ncbi:MAG: 16S rRNA (guanine(966)-N(2))-methyltransferase RsmD, partial [Chloroflexota bacterium]
VPGDTTRPVTDMVKEALFNIIGDDVLDTNWWDLFGGTGAIGIEALSRGAKFIRFTDLNRLPIDTIKDNLNTCGFSSFAEVRRGDAFAFLKSKADKQFEYIYIAPPQYKEMWSDALKLVDANTDWLSDTGEVIVQINPIEAREQTLVNLKKFDERKYGSTLLIFYEKNITNTSSSGV